MKKTTNDEHFHILIYAKGVRIYDLKRDRIGAVDDSLRLLSSIYTTNENDYNEMYTLFSQNFAEEPDEELNIVFPVEDDLPIKFAIYYCNDPEECEEDASPCLN